MKLISRIILVVSFPVLTFAQSPQKMSYQAVVRDASNALVSNATVGMQVSILQGSASGTAVYVEMQTPVTNANGLVSIEIGSGAVISGDFSLIDWVNGPYFIKTETDPTGGANYTISGISQLLSVPYALHSKTAEIAINDADTDSTNEIELPTTAAIGDILMWNGTNWVSAPAMPTTKQAVTADMNDSTIQLSIGKIKMRVHNGYLQVAGDGVNLSLGLMLTLKKDQSATWNGYPTTPKFGVESGYSFLDGVWKDLLEGVRGETGTQDAQGSAGLWYYSLYEIEMFDIYSGSNDSYKVSVWVDGLGKVHMRGTYYPF